MSLKHPSTTANPPTCSKQFAICDDVVTDGKGDDLPQSDLKAFKETAWMDENDHHRGNICELISFSKLIKNHIYITDPREKTHARGQNCSRGNLFFFC